MLGIVSTALAWVALLWSGALAAQDDGGRFEVRTASVVVKDGVYFLDARLLYRLSGAALEALESGVPLTIEMQITMSRVRRWWLDPEVAELKQQYQVQYNALSQRYRVTNLNSGEQNSFGTLFSALNSVGTVTELPLIDASLLEQGKRYEMRIRSVLDLESFPGPLRLLAFWRNDLDLESEWYEWRLVN